MINKENFKKTFPDYPYSYEQWVGEKIISIDGFFSLNGVNAKELPVEFYHWNYKGREITFYELDLGDVGIVCDRIFMYDNWYLSAKGITYKLQKLNFETDEVIEEF